MEETSGTLLGRRRAAVLFADVSGFSARVGKLGAERAHRLIGDCLERMGEVVVRHGGYVHQYEGDCVMALFGAPIPLERASRAAVNAAIEIHRRVGAFSAERGLDEPLLVHSGIASGVLLAGAMRRYSADSFGVIGSPVIVAARLKDAAPRGRIYVGPDTFLDTREEFDYRAVGSLSLKGLPEKVATYEVTSAEPHHHTASETALRRVSAPLLGRERELERLRSWLEARAKGAAGAAFIVGEAGAGKSRVLRELASSVSVRHLRWLHARARFEAQRAAFHPIADLLASWLELSVREDPLAARRRLEAACHDVVGETAARILPFLTQMLGLPLWPEDELGFGQMSAEAIEVGTREALGILLGTLAQRVPLVIAVEDLHWSDRSTVRLLEAMVDGAAQRPISFLFTTRPGHPDSSGRVLRRFTEVFREQAIEVPLDPLEGSTSRALVAALLESAGLSRDLEEEIARRAGGNPFFAEEIVRWLAARGPEVELPDVPRPAALQSGDLPGTIHDVLQNRVGALDAASGALLRLVSVAGRAIHHPVLEQLASTIPDLEARLARLVETQLLTPSHALATPGYEFEHPLIQEVTYGSIPEDERPVLHLRVAEAIEKRLPAHLPGFDAMLAYHYARCDDPALAERYLDAAGDAATRLAAAEEAVHFFGEAVDRFLANRNETAQPERGAELERKLAIAYMNRGDLKQAVAHFDRALELLGERRGGSRGLQIARLARVAARLASELYAPRLRPRRPPATPVQRSVIEIMYARAQAETTHDPSNFVRDTLTALARLSRVDPRSIERAGAMYASAVGIFSFGGFSFGIGQRLLNLGRPLVNANDDSDAFLYRTMAFLHQYLSGDWSESHLIEPAVVDQQLARGRLWEVTTYCNLEAAYRSFRGQFEEAEAQLARLDTIHARYGFDLAASARDGISAYLALERRDLDAALRAAEHYLRAHTAPLFNITALGMLAKVHALRGDLDAAAAVLTQGKSLLARTGGVAPYHANHPRCAELVLLVARMERAAAGRDGESLAALGREASRAGRAALRVAARFAARRPEIHRLIGTAAWLGGQRAAAIRSWESAISSAQALGQRPELGRAYAEAGGRLGDRDRNRVAGLGGRELLQKAAEFGPTGEAPPGGSAASHGVSPPRTRG